ncbi:oligoribonuclease, mitochondrial-like isoform X1 [Photinus pyralis]|nr:oligoribonuclease, mitochondrial-like isoform X1 [Photinus pyralis]
MMLRNTIKGLLSFVNSGSLKRPMSTISPLQSHRIVWIDMEMTGLDIEKDRIMEIACIVTDGNLNVVAEGPNVILNVPKDILENMNGWCLKQHNKTGLTESSLNSKITAEIAETELLNFISNHVVEKCSPLAGNSVYMDRLFLRKFMPRVDSYLHYRIVDVSSIKELCRIWNRDVYKNAPTKTLEHRALQDIRESIQELQFYRMNFFNL